MKARPPGPDGSLGFTLQADTMEARLWFSYLSAIGRPTGLMMERLRAGKGYMVPTQTPMEFDRGWKPPRLLDVSFDEGPSEMSVAEREAIVARVVSTATFRPKVHGRYAQEDTRIEERSAPVARDLTAGERESMARLLGPRHSEAAE